MSLSDNPNPSDAMPAADAWFCMSDYRRGIASPGWERLCLLTNVSIALRRYGEGMSARNTPPIDGVELSSRKVIKFLLLEPSSGFAHEPPPGFVSPVNTTWVTVPLFLPFVSQTNSPPKLVASPVTPE